jgi:hypothetical protein
LGRFAGGDAANTADHDRTSCAHIHAANPAAASFFADNRVARNRSCRDASHSDSRHFGIGKEADSSARLDDTSADTPGVDGNDNQVGDGS